MSSSLLLGILILLTSLVSSQELIPGSFILSLNMECDSACREIASSDMSVHTVTGCTFSNSKTSKVGNFFFEILMCDKVTSNINNVKESITRVFKKVGVEVRSVEQDEVVTMEEAIDWKSVWSAKQKETTHPSINKETERIVNNFLNVLNPDVSDESASTDQSGPPNGIGNSGMDSFTQEVTMDLPNGKEQTLILPNSPAGQEWADIIPFVSPSPSKTPSPSPSTSITASPSSTASPSATQSPSPSQSSSFSPSPSSSASVSPSPTKKSQSSGPGGSEPKVTATPTSEAPISQPTPSASPTMMSVITVDPTVTATPSFSPGTPINTVTPSPSASMGSTPSSSPSTSPSVLASPTFSPSASPSASASPSCSPSVYPSVSTSPSHSSSPTPSPSPSPPPTTCSLTPSKTSLWGIDETDGGYPLDDKRTCPCTNLGNTVNVWIFDTGCEPTNGGLCHGYYGADNGQTLCTDNHGHGNHVGGTATDGTEYTTPENGLEGYGVAKNAIRSCMKVLSDSGSGARSNIISGLAYVEERIGNYAHNVINMSLSGSASSSYNAVIESLAVKGVYFAVAAGNDNINACNKSPASASGPTIFTVEAHDENGNPAWFTNFGEAGNDCTDISAPGVGIVSIGGTKQGTSMATPHVAGAIATLLSDGKAVTLSALTSGGRDITGKTNRITKKSLGLTCQ